MEYFTAASYENYERVGEPYYNNSGKLATKIKYECPRCSGKGIIITRVENGHPIPIPVAGGVCFQCDGKKFLTKEVRLYTKAERERIDAAAARAKERREKKRQEEIEQNFAQNKHNWLLRNGFNEEGYTYIIIGDSFSIKNELKLNGWIYDPILKWHKTDPAGYKDRVIQIHVDELFTFSAWGIGYYKENAGKILDEKREALNPSSCSEYIGEIGEKISFIVTIIKKNSFEGRYGISNVITFETEEGNILTWFTSTVVNLPLGTQVEVSATVKSHEEYKKVKTTYITRAKIKEVAF